MLAYHNDPAIKQMFIDRIAAHAAADEIVKGYYWEDGKGCAIGCTYHSSDHLAAEREAGIPLMLARLEDTIFEGLPNAEAMTWPLRFAEAIQVGADLSMVAPRFLLWLLRDSGIPGHDHPDVAPAFRECVDVMQSWCDLGIPDGSAAYRAREAIRDHAHENSAVVMEPAGGAARAAEHAMYVAIDTYLQRPSRAIDSAVWSILGADNAVSANAQSAHEIANITNRSRALLEFYMTAAIKLLELMEMAPIAD